MLSKEFFRDRLRALRKELKETQKQTAAAVGIAERHYQKIEYGHINVPATTVKFLADFFDVTTDYLLGQDAG